MFLKKTIEHNQSLVDISNELMISKRIRPDTYVVDIDSLIENAKKMLTEAKEYKVKLYFMLKQLGRNPYIAKKLVSLGYEGAVVVDYKEAEIMMEHNIPISHAGHLVQIPRYLMDRLVSYGVGNITVFSVENARMINDSAKKSNRIQNIFIKVVDEGDSIYSGQMSGIELEELLDFSKEISKFSNIRINGLTVFPAVLFDETTLEFEKTHNLDTLKKAKRILEENGIVIEELNMPSATCIASIKKIAEYGGTSGEPGHGFSGTTPGHSLLDFVEKPCVTYVSEISHHFKGQSYFYGGGYYRRGHFENALVMEESGKSQIVSVIPPDLDSIDYYFSVNKKVPIGVPVVGAFRFQVFVTRSDIAIVKGIHGKNVKIIGIYDSLGKEINKYD